MVIIYKKNYFKNVKGCFLDNKDCYDRQHCVEKSSDRKKQLFFCCCDGNLCNKNFSWDPQPTPPPPHVVQEYEPHPNADEQLYTLVILISVPALLLVVIIICASLYFYRRKKMRYFNEVK